MKKALYQFVILSLIGILMIMFNYTYLNVFINRKIPTGNRVIIVDAGHGGIDGGAIGKTGTIEKDINLEIATKLKGYIEEQGDTCIMIREVDEGLYSEYGKIRNKKNEDLKNRKDIIKKNKGDIFISIHLNSFPQSQYYGAQVFYQTGDKKSEKLAKYTQEELRKILGRGNERVEKASDSYYILKGNTVPSMLVECGFLSNYEEEKLLKDKEYQNKIAWSIYSGIMRFVVDGEESSDS